jgi:MFS family permease
VAAFLLERSAFSVSAVSQAELDRIQKQKLAYFRRNVIANLGVEGFWGAGMSLASWLTILPVFMQRLGAGEVLIGALPAIGALGFTLLQVPAAYLTTPLQKKKMPFVWLHVPACLAWLFIALFTHHLAATQARLMLTLFLVLFAIYTVSLGVVIPIWTDFINRLMPASRRGRAFGLMFMSGNIAGVVGAGLAGYLLKRLPFPDNYGSCFALSFVTISIGSALIATTREPDGRPRPPRAPAREFLRDLVRVVRGSRHLQRFLVVRGLLDLATMAGGFYAVYAVARFRLADEAAGVFTAATIIPQIATSFLWGWLGDRAGYKAVTVASAALRVSAAGLAVIAPNVYVFYVVFALLGMALNGDWVATPNLVVEMCPDDDKTAYVSLANTALALPRGVAPLLGGLLAANASYVMLFVVAFVLQVVGTIGFAAVVHEPRRSAGAEAVRVERL